MYYGDALKRELIDTNAYTPQASLSERVVVNGHGCPALHFGIKAKETQKKILTLYWLPKLPKNHRKQDLLLILIMYDNRTSKLLTSCLTAVKNMSKSTVLRKRYMKGPVRVYFGLLKIHMKY